MRQKVTAAVGILILLAAALTGCVNQQNEGLPDVFPIDFLFTSGVGAWGTVITLEQDGTFNGGFCDTDMGSSGEGYPNGTAYVCNFSGHFTDIKQLDKYRFSLTLGELNSHYEAGKEWIENGVRYVSSEPYGMESGKEFILYLPETPIDGFSERFLSWWPYYWMKEEKRPDSLNLYALCNVEMEYVFFG